MRFLHTSDWHLGHRLHGYDRSAEHLHFLKWLAATIRDQAIDVVLIAGDIFDTANPSAQALAMWYDFVVQVTRENAGLQIVAVGGNHDSAARLDAPQPLLASLAVAMRGGRNRDGRALTSDEFMIEVRSRDGAERGFVAAVPFLRPSDLPVVQNAEHEIDLIAGTRQFYADIFEHMRSKALPSDLLLAMGHLYLHGAALSELSERQILGGNQHALPWDLFPDFIDYVALGHLHRAQKVGRETIRYCGSPLPLALDERGYRHQVVVIDAKKNDVSTQTTLSVLTTPRILELPRIPESGACAFEEALLAIQSLPALEVREGLAARGPQALLEVAILVHGPTPQIRAQVEAALANKGYLLARLTVQSVHSNGLQLPEQSESYLDELKPVDVLHFLWQRDFGEDAPAPIVHAYHQLLDRVHQEQAR
jgi:exonuclease SbcD